MAFENNTSNLTNTELHDAVVHIREAIEAAPERPNETVRIVISSRLPDRRLSYPDQKLHKELLSAAKRSRTVTSLPLHMLLEWLDQDKP